jgi:hypothetical protein
MYRLFGSESTSWFLECFHYGIDGIWIRANYECVQQMESEGETDKESDKNSDVERVHCIGFVVIGNNVFKELGVVVVELRSGEEGSTDNILTA